MNKSLNRCQNFGAKRKSGSSGRHMTRANISSKAERVRFANLKPSMTAISLRLPVVLLECIKVAANKRDVFYQSLIKTWVAEKIRIDRRRSG